MSMKDDFKARFKKPKVKALQIEGGPIYIRVISLKEREDLENAIGDDADKRAQDGQKRALLLSFALCDVDGTRLFGKEDIPEIAEFSSEFLASAWSEAWDFNCLGQEQIDKQKKSFAGEVLNGSGSTSV
jgi:hypothetical protein